MVWATFPSASKKSTRSLELGTSIQTACRIVEFENGPTVIVCEVTEKVEGKQMGSALEATAQGNRNGMKEISEVVPIVESECCQSVKRMPKKRGIERDEGDSQINKEKR